MFKSNKKVQKAGRVSNEVEFAHERLSRVPFPQKAVGSHSKVNFDVTHAEKYHNKPMLERWKQPRKRGSVLRVITDFRQELYNLQDKHESNVLKNLGLLGTSTENTHMPPLFNRSKIFEYAQQSDVQYTTLTQRLQQFKQSSPRIGIGKNKSTTLTSQKTRNQFFDTAQNYLTLPLVGRSQ